ncbi:hypothetical protein [Paraliobacillus salinarum]|uniref:hypothetical protein n=1 Tax=Paraliobacillus salinarum TaxID=1158996 RepID=UPI0015F43157|nr:hypothetical protein [Paraliobacillus salinarum]
MRIGIDFANGDDYTLSDRVLACVKEVKSRMVYGETTEQSFNNAIYIYELSESEKRYLDNYFVRTPPT